MLNGKAFFSSSRFGVACFATLVWIQHDFQLKCVCNICAYLMKYFRKKLLNKFGALAWCCVQWIVCVFFSFRCLRKFSILITIRRVSHIISITRVIGRWTLINEAEATATRYGCLLQTLFKCMCTYVGRRHHHHRHHQTQQQLFPDDQLNTWQKGGKCAEFHINIIPKWRGRERDRDRVYIAFNGNMGAVSNMNEMKYKALKIKVFALPEVSECVRCAKHRIASAAKKKRRTCNRRRMFAKKFLFFSLCHSVRMHGQNQNRKTETVF